MRKAKVYANSSAHVKAAITALIFGERRIDIILGEQCRVDISAHNRIFEKNRKNFVEVIKDDLLAWKAGARFSTK